MVSESKSGDDDTDTDVEEDPIVDQGTRTGCPNTCGNWARRSKSSFLRFSVILPNYKGQNKVMSARVYFCKRLKIVFLFCDVEWHYITFLYDKQSRETTVLCL